jgi:hypothetical protein
LRIAAAPCSFFAGLAARFDERTLRADERLLIRAMVLLSAKGFPCHTAASNSGGERPDAKLGTILPRPYHSGTEIMTNISSPRSQIAFVAASSAAPEHGAERRQTET